jgi:RNA polymerase sigma factor (sigma-70 family)
MTRQLKMTKAADGTVIAYMEHPELNLPGRTKQLLAAAEEVLASGKNVARTHEATLFKALHAAGCAIHAARKSPAKRERLCGFYQRILDYLVSENIGLVYDMRRRSRIADVDPDDLFSEGLWRLFQAVRRFDPWRGFRFSTYACTSILRGFVSLRRKKRCENETMDKIKRGVECTEEGIIEECNLDDNLLAEQIRDLLLGTNAALTPVERFVIARRLLHPQNTSPDTLQAIGEMFKLSKERIRQIQLTALEKLRHILGEDHAPPGTEDLLIDTARDRVIAGTAEGTKPRVATVAA